MDIERTDQWPQKTEPKWWSAFLGVLSSGATVTLAARGAGVALSTVYDARKAHPGFAERWDLAEESSTQALEAEARRRALAGSDVLMIFLLKARRPSVYREMHRVELTGKDGEPMRMETLMDPLKDHEKRALRDAIEAELRRREVEGAAPGPG